MSYKVAIIGSGIAGIASAIRLARRGHQVEVFEAASQPGGKLNEITLGKYRFDAGPSLFTLPQLVDELFSLCGENPREHFHYSKLPINCQYFFSDGTELTAFADHKQLKQEIHQKTGESPEAVDQAIENSRQLYDTLSELFMFSSLQDIRTFFNKTAFKAYLRIPRLGFFQTMDGANKALFRDPRMVQLFNRYATYNGSSPYKTPATMNIIPHLEMSIGAYFPQGGMYAITKALVALAERQGVVFHYNTRVDKILIERKRIVGIRVGDNRLPYDRVVSNMDIVNSYKKLMPQIKAPSFLLKQPKSSSALIFYWGIKKQFKQLDVHNIFFSGDYKDEFEHLFEKGTISDDPTVYIHISSKCEASDAPTYGENWFTMINVPNNQGQNWDQLITEARVKILKKLSSQLGTPIEDFIECEDYLDPRLIESKTSSAQGALYGNSSNNLFAAFLRHANKSRRIKGLYFCGGSVHPGGGIPMSLSSAKIMADSFS
ncbi:1-hydroxycarotenoid 3,4-desaturase CrtD [Marinoscillum sp.]|uniref:1-hydroxycarotenoid 3,4-desaturase CrtD n=1 Tax=Marinoscillum sp. TaxID=2024838 RepID=UPI003BAAF23C